MSLIFVILMAGLVLLTVSLKKSYHVVSVKELKRRAREGDEFAKLLFKAVGYGASLSAILWLLIGLSAAGFFLLVSRTTPAWFAFLAMVVVLWLGFYWIPSSRVTKYGLQIAAWLAPAFGWVLNYLHPVLDWLISFVRRHRPVRVHTGLYDKQDLLELLEKQQVQADSRIEKTELQIAWHALTFGDKIVRDVLTPRRVVHAVSVADTVGPVLMAELHDSGFSRFPVYDGKKENIVGTLYLRDMTKEKTGKQVQQLMRDNDVCYLHEDQPLTEALAAILKTRRHLMIVVNGFEEYVGVVTIEDVLEQIVGHKIVDEFDQYDDMRAVAAKMASTDHKRHADHTAPSPDPSDTTKEPTEVVE